VFAMKIDLTLSPYRLLLSPSGGELKKRTLGLGDALGACTIYNTCPP
jgi:hypothetical protein